MSKNQKKNKDPQYKAEDVLEKLNHWYKMINFYVVGSTVENQFRDDFHYIRDAVIEFNKDKQVDRLRFAKKFKALFAKQNQELAEENIEVKKELYKEKVHVQQLEKELEEVKKDD